jgi:hypothetical protein
MVSPFVGLLEDTSADVVVPFRADGAGGAKRKSGECDTREVLHAGGRAQELRQPARHLYRRRSDESRYIPQFTNSRRGKRTGACARKEIRDRMLVVP